MINPLEIAFSNLVFFYPDFRPQDAVASGASPRQLRLLGTINRATATGRLGERGLMVYVHIPFCRHICRFCGYHRKRLVRQDEASSYVDRLIAEIRVWSEKLAGSRRPVDVLYFGGGTPGLLTPRDFARLVDALRQAFDLTGRTEFDIESDLPSLADARRLEAWRHAGVGRVSFGVQSLDDDVRKTAGIDTFGNRAEIFAGADRLRRAGFGVHYDLMFGLPGQSVGSFLADIRATIGDLAADHVDLLEYFPQPGTWFTRRFEEYEAITARRGRRREMYAGARRLLRSDGYTQHTLTDFWREPQRPASFKAMLYGRADILGLGAGSNGIVAGVAYRNRRLEEGYVTSAADELPLAAVRPLSPSVSRTRSLVLLPKLLAFSAGDFAGAIGKTEHTLLRQFAERGYLARRGDRYRVTVAGMLHSGDMMLDVLRTRATR